MPITLRAAAVFAAAVTIAGGFQFGYGIGYVPVCLQYYMYVTNCTRYEAQPACGASAGCSWIPLGPRFDSGNGTCVFNDRIGKLPCAAISDENLCTDNSGCYWDASEKQCEHEAGWSAVETGLLASAMIIGAMIGSLVAAPVLGFLQRKKTIILAGLIVLVTSVIQTIAWQKDVYGLLVASRMIMGVGIGFGSVASPLYCGEVAPPRFRGVIGVSYQIACTAGIFLASLLGLIISPVNDVREDEHLVARFHVMNAFSMLAGLAYTIAGVVAPEPTPELAKEILQAEAEAADADVSDVHTRVNASEIEEPLDGDDPSRIEFNAAVDANAEPSSSKFALLARPLVTAILMSVALQFTGINAIMNYAPKMTSNAGLNPLVGNCLVMAWNFIFTLVSIPLAKRIEPRKTFIAATFAASIACLVTGIPTYPGVIDNEKAQHACIWIGLLAFVAIFEIGIGPPFYPLSQAVFPSSYRNFGCSFGVMVQFALNVAVNFGFPVAVQALAGGKNGNQNKGQALMFIIFGAFGVVTAAVLLKVMKPVVV